MKTMISRIMLTLLLIGLLTLAFNIQTVKASGTIYIRADGSIDPPTAPISSDDNITYTFTDNIYDFIAIERDNVILDGANYTMEGAWNSYGIKLLERKNVTITNLKITAFLNGIYLEGGSDINISRNEVVDNGNGIYLLSSSKTIISGNNVTDNFWNGIHLDNSPNTTITANNITFNSAGIYLEDSLGAAISENHIAGNSPGIYLLRSSNATIVDNSLTENYESGIYLSYSSNATMIANSLAENYEHGIHLSHSSNTTVSRNDLIGNLASGISFASCIILEFSSGNIISENNMTSSRYGLSLSGVNNTISGNSFVGCGLYVNMGDSKSNIVVGNYVNGKPLVYLVDVTGAAISDAGQAILVDCENVIVENSDLSNATLGIRLIGTSDSEIRWNNITKNMWGVNLLYCGNITISENNIASNEFGISFGDIIITPSYVSNTTIVGNNITGNSCGISMGRNSSYSIVSENNIMNNYLGIWLAQSLGNRIFHNNIVGNDRQVSISDSLNVWDDGYPSGGNYWSDYNGTDIYTGPYQNETGSDGIGDTPYVIDENNQDNYPLLKPYPWDSHDLGITSITISKTVVGQGFDLCTNITLFNYGNNTESFDVTAYANTTIIKTESVVLTSRDSTTITLTWNTTGVAKGNYTISAYAEPVLGETDTTDNTKYGDQEVCVAIPGDINGDWKVDLSDVLAVALAFGARPGDPLWNPNLDVDGNGKVDLTDYLATALNYGKVDL